MKCQLFKICGHIYNVDSKYSFMQDSCKKYAPHFHLRYIANLMTLSL